MKKRRVAAITGEGGFIVVEEPVPEPEKGQVLVDVKATLISPGTELGTALHFRANPDPAVEPMTFGYGNAGVVIGQGPGCDDIPLGMRVACMGGDYALHSDFACVPRNLLVPIPEGVSFEEAAFAHLGATALHAIQRAQLQYGEYVVVLGLGIVGQCVVQMGMGSGTHVVALDRLAARLETARKIGGVELALNSGEEEDLAGRVKEFTRGYGLDCAIFAFGGDITEPLKETAGMMKVAPDGHKMGRIVIVGGSTFHAAGWPVAMGNMDIRPSARPGPGYHDVEWEHGRDYPPVFVQWTTRRNLEEVLVMASLGRLDFKGLITHRLPLEDFGQGAEALISTPNEALGVMLIP
ncbi:MAG: zinc-binding alcohol dehydrogenase [Phycisphaerae bacterium]|jgi:threonine dehydrogenase-like Zn-dependent dehydrogenase|nr:zinc-binding alcohol dehydrogenase [Phycisphaerae bacterium]